ncbi:hypothetical protein F7734_31570 [Scytonema sp. UIC 10036]|uniref:hypothetical protein n=1 Tax=Scytonema sp. UIC 10036 TaxID=2304196 RepID=UPI0012DA7F9C|nr:hypothetical protein [Scytonema sp. UIC 10036]MUG96634.1 hypothetical protein [Scytonema sp. UIC 10036]
MPYSQFTLKKLVKDFNLKIEENIVLFPEITPVPPSDFLVRFLDKTVPLALATDTEKSRSEMIIFPVLLEVKEQKCNEVALFSGNDFTVDPNLGLNGNPDFLISLDKEQYFISAPVMTIVEAKNNNLNSGLGQCGAEMLAAKIFNENEGKDVSAIHGCVTSGTAWKFLRLINNILYIDKLELSLFPCDRLLGIFLSILQ